MTKIFVVEDEPGIALGLEDDLRLEGYEVEVSGDGVLACRRAREERFDLILLDVMLPGKDFSRRQHRRLRIVEVLADRFLDVVEESFGLMDDKGEAELVAVTELVVEGLAADAGGSR